MPISDVINHRVMWNGPRESSVTFHVTKALTERNSRVVYIVEMWTGAYYTRTYGRKIRPAYSQAINAIAEYINR